MKLQRFFTCTRRSCAGELGQDSFLVLSRGSVGSSLKRILPSTCADSMLRLGKRW